ncbi:hypothetical protein [uncultured Caulobacter sp.]|uniref:hypothetical protein n=1 Tax=uncultured Caulobacter sp. TaxID=158749 RepID=UPI0026142BC9|nr:hypothetical protein [uncultured Caulobacter sp.]
MEKFVNALKEFAWPFGLCGGTFALIVRFLPEGSIPLSLALAIAAVWAAVTITLIVYIAKASSGLRPNPIEIEQIIEFGSLFLIKKTDLLGFSMGAQLFYRDGNHERLIGQGSVINVQMNGMPQLKVEYISAVEPALMSEISEGKRPIRERLIVKPGVVMLPRIQETENEEPQ